MNITKQIYITYAEALRKFIFSKTKNMEVTDDILQEVFIKIHTKLNTLDDRTKIKSWVFSIANYAVMDYFRASKKEVLLSDLSQELEGNEESSFYDHSEKDCLYGIIKRLPKKYRDPLYLADIKGLKQFAIADQLKMPLSTVKSQIQRARKMIAQGYMDCCDYKMNEKGHLVGEMKSKEDCKMCN